MDLLHQAPWYSDGTIISDKWLVREKEGRWRAPASPLGCVLVSLACESLRLQTAATGEGAGRGQADSDTHPKQNRPPPWIMSNSRGRDADGVSMLVCSMLVSAGGSIIFRDHFRVLIWEQWFPPSLTISERYCCEIIRLIHHLWLLHGSHSKFGGQ